MMISPPTNSAAANLAVTFPVYPLFRYTSKSVLPLKSCTDLSPSRRKLSRS
jgi:hypothetical protein